jgi:hypothetical protein
VPVCNKCGVALIIGENWHESWKARRTYSCAKCHAVRRNESALRRRYNLSVEHFEVLRKAQNGACAICGRPLETRAETCVDHCHSTQEVRGLLCRSCNLGIGYLNDDPRLIAQALHYIKNARHEARVAFNRTNCGDEPYTDRKRHPSLVKEAWPWSWKNTNGHARRSGLELWGTIDLSALGT